MYSLVLMTTKTLASRCICATEIYEPKFVFIPHCQRTTFVIFSRRLGHDEVGGRSEIGGRGMHESGAVRRGALYLEAMAD